MVIDGSKKSPTVRKNQKKYWVKIRINFLAARKEHNIKTLLAAFTSVFSFIPSQDEINPRFIREARNNLFMPIQELQKRAELLLKAGKIRNSRYRPDPFYKAVMEIMASWDIKALDKELSLLEKQIQGLNVETLAGFCRVLFTPIIRLQNLDPEYQVTNSIRHYFQLYLKLNQGADKEKIAPMKKRSLELMGYYPLVFRRIHHGCYPLLMTLSCSSYSQYNDFYSHSLSEYLGFLSLEEARIITPPGEMPPISPEENNPTQTEWHAKEEKTVIPGEFTEGLRFLQKMFPPKRI